MRQKLLVLGFILLVGYIGFRMIVLPAQDTQTGSANAGRTGNGTEEQAQRGSGRNGGQDTSARVKGDVQTQISRRSVFVPYWADLSQPFNDTYDRYIYFGIEPTVDGINQDESGYLSLDAFDRAIEGLETGNGSGTDNGAEKTEKWLTLRMVDRSLIAEILSTAASWQKVADGTAAVATEHGYDGVVLDLEVGLLAVASEEDITQFSSFFVDEMKKDGFPVAIAVYGDNYYRGRPYDIQKLGQISDELIIMAYDFTKSFGLPGPNFPLAGEDEFGYDFQSMIDDFSQQAPPEKLSVAYGMFGYEWIVDSKGRPLKQATAVTVNEVRNGYLGECSAGGELAQCSVERHPQASEQRLEYTGDEDRTHVVWFEDEESVDQKNDALLEHGIDSIVYWAWGYF